jgi:hypothetical protein
MCLPGRMRLPGPPRAQAPFTLYPPGLLTPGEPYLRQIPDLWKLGAEGVTHA